jgi:hypothetical protein
VAWHDNDQCGVFFNKPLDHNGIQQLKQLGSVGRAGRRLVCSARGSRC